MVPQFSIQHAYLGSRELAVLASIPRGTHTACCSSSAVNTRFPRCGIHKVHVIIIIKLKVGTRFKYKKKAKSWLREDRQETHRGTNGILNKVRILADMLQNRHLCGKQQINTHHPCRSKQSCLFIQNKKKGQHQ